MNAHARQLTFLVLRWVYILFATIALSMIGMLSAAAGHAPLTMLEASGSWYALLLRALSLLDSFVFQSWIWNNTIGSSGGLGMVVAHVGIPIGFVLFYPFLRWCVSLRLGLSTHRAFVIAYAIGSGLAVLANACCAGRNFSLITVLLLGGIGVLLGVGFVSLDSLLLRLANADSHVEIGRHRQPEGESNQPAVPHKR